jgi:hypothetical protein
VAAVVARVSIPANHSAVCLLKLAEMPFSGPNALFLRTLLNKKYALPLRVIDALVAHFLSFVDGRQQMPVLWHQVLFFPPFLRFGSQSACSSRSFFLFSFFLLIILHTLNSLEKGL